MSTLSKARVSVVALALSVAACGGGASGGGAETGSGGGSVSGGETTASSGGGGGQTAPADEGDRGEFHLADSTTADQAHGEHPSAIHSSATEAALRFFVVDPDAGALQGIVIKLEGSDGRVYYTDETDAQGYAEVLVNPGQRYDLEYLSLGRRSTSAHVEVPAGPNQDITLTLRYRTHRVTRHTELTMPDQPAPEPEHLVLDGILLESGSATIDPSSNPRLDRVVEFMTHMTHVRIQIAGHTDNVGNPQRNLALSQQRAEAVRAYLVAHGIDGSRIEAVGYGDTRPVASNDTEEGRAQNRRIEATEL